MARTVTPADWSDDKGRCYKCRGTGEYRWGAVVNGVSTHRGVCFACKGTGRITQEDAYRNDTYWNKYARIEI